MDASTHPGAIDVTGIGDVVVSPHHLATQAGMQILAEGGNALDAAIAANAVQGTVAPDTCGIGGDLFALVWTGSDAEPLTLNASGWAGSGVDADELREAGHAVMPPLDPQTVTIPGCVAGWEALSDRGGSMPLSRLLEPSIRLAEKGFPASVDLCRALEARHDALAGQSSPGEWYPGGTTPLPRDRITRPLLARTLRAIAAGGADAFYRGDAAQDISDAVDGRITLDDLAGYRPDWVEPLRMDVFGHTGWTVPPNSQGYITLAAARIFDGLDPSEPVDPAWTHLLVEAYRSVAWDRNDVLADPAYAPERFARWLEPSHLAAVAAAIDPDRAGTWPRPAEKPGGTAYLCVVDRDGMAVSLIQSNFWGIGTNIGAGRSGFVLHNRGGGFDLRPDHPNELAPGKRPLHTLSPSLWTRDGELTAVLGTRGGHQQPQLLIQMAARMFRHGASPATAQGAARWTMDDFGPGQDSTVKVEARMDPAVVLGLESRGHHVVVEGDYQAGWGPVSVITVDPDTGLRTGSADPRVATATAGAR